VVPFSVLHEFFEAKRAHNCSKKVNVFDLNFVSFTAVVFSIVSKLKRSKSLQPIGHPPPRKLYLAGVKKVREMIQKKWEREK
jgi:hypothetical protein